MGKIEFHIISQISMISLHIWEITNILQVFFDVGSNTAFVYKETVYVATNKITDLYIIGT